MEYNSTLAQDDYSPIKPAKVEQLFSPDTKSPARAIDNLTYRIPAIPDVLVDFPCQSTAIKGSQNRPLCSTVKKTNLQANCNNFQPFHQIKEARPIRATCFHPSGEVYAIGSNSKTLRLYAYPSRKDQDDFSLEDPPREPQVMFNFVGLHRGSVYCTAFNRAGSLLATGSNDQTVRLIRYDAQNHMPTGSEYIFDIHNGKVRDVSFLDNLLASAGSGDNSIILTDCKAMKRVLTMTGHKDSVMSLHCWSNDSTTFVSGGLDGAIKFWDARARRCTKTTGNHSPVGVVRVDPSGRLLVSGHENGTCMLYDIRAAKQMQVIKAHAGELRSLNISPKSYYLLSAGYDGRVKLMDIQGDLTKKLPTVEIANLGDKIIQTAWHPSEYTFVTTSADGLATLWMMPDSNNNS